MSHLSSQLLRNFYKTTPMREGLLTWYPFDKDASVLESSGGALTGLLRARCGAVKSFDGEFDGEAGFDYVVAIDPGEISVRLLERYHTCLNAHGRLLLAFENPFGLQYFAGKRNPRTDLPFAFQDGESKEEVERRLMRAGFAAVKWYYPFTNHYFTREVYSQACPPNEFLNHRGFEFIEDDYTKAFDERPLWGEIIRGGAFAFMCDAYLAEARVCAEDAACAVDYAAITAYRERDKAFVTAVRNDGTAQKRAIFPEGAARLERMRDNHRELADCGVNVLPVELSGDTLTMKRLDLPTVWDFWTQKIGEGALRRDLLFSHFDRIRESIYKAAKNGKLFWELVPANCFYDEEKDELIFFDQEYYWEDVDVDMGVVRALCAMKYSFAFYKFPETEAWLAELKDRCGLSEKWDDLARRADFQTAAYVFNDDHTEPLRIAAERAERRMRERARERDAVRAAERAAEKARYEKMCAAVVSLKAMRVARPAIYGYGLRGKMLRYALEALDIDAVCVIDKARPVVCGLPLLGTIDEIPAGSEPDVIIVTPVKDAKPIADGLRAKARCPVVTVEELVNG
jgi:hypothetical protein